MVHSININCLSSYNLKMGISDYIVFRYGETKMNKTGEFAQEKNVYSSPLNGEEHLRAFSAMGCYLSIHCEQFEDTEKFFICPGSPFCTAAQNFALQLGEIAKRYFDIVRNHVCLPHFNIHVVKKGSNTHAAPATPVPLFLLQLLVEVSGTWGRY